MYVSLCFLSWLLGNMYRSREIAYPVIAGLIPKKTILYVLSLTLSLAYLWEIPLLRSLNMHVNH